MPRTLLRNASVVLPDSLASSWSIVVDGETIETVGPDDAIQALDADTVVDAGGRLVSAGLIDLHIHGAHEHLVDNGFDALRALCELLPRYGVTGFLPTVSPRPKGEDARCLADLAPVQSTGGTRILGFHLEGPFLSLTGAMPPEALGDADPDRVRALQEAARPHRTIFSIAPDFDGILELIPLMCDGDGTVFMTHTAADVAQTRAAIEAGARHATHFYDVFPCPDVRDPGVRPCGAVEAILADPRVSVDFILDGEHVDPIAIELALQCKGPEGVCLITDANVGAGLAPGRFSYLGRDVTFAYPGAPARTADSDVLAGSGLTLDRAVRNAVTFLAIEPDQAIRMASACPARVLGLAETMGCIQPGAAADLVLWNEDLEPARTWIAGQCVYEAEAPDRASGPDGA